MSPILTQELRLRLSSYFTTFVTHLFHPSFGERKSRPMSQGLACLDGKGIITSSSERSRRYTRVYSKRGGVIR